MFLNVLNEKEKLNFVRLAEALIKADGVIKESEIQVLLAYKNEMQIQLESVQEIKDINCVIDDFANFSTITVKRIVYIELLALALSDGVYVDEEQTIMATLLEKFQLNDAFKERAIQLTDQYTNAYTSILQLVEGGE